MSSNKKTISLRVPDDIYGFLKVLSNSENRSLNKQIVTIIEEWMAMQKEGRGKGDLVIQTGDFDLAKWAESIPPDANISWGGNWVSNDITITSFGHNKDQSVSSINFTTGRAGNDQMIRDMIKSEEYNTRLFFQKKDKDDG